MKLAELRVNVHNRGNFVTVRCITRPVLGFTTLFAGIEDENGDVGHLTLDTLNFPGEDAFPMHSIVAIKQPYFTISPGQEGLPTAGLSIVVEHFSDMLILQSTDPRVPTSFRAVVADPNQYALSCKENGNLALKAEISHMR